MVWAFRFIALLLLALTAKLSFGSDLIAKAERPNLCRVWLRSPAEIENALRDGLGSTLSRLLAVSELQEAVNLTAKTLSQKTITTELAENQVAAFVVGLSQRGEVQVSIRPDIAEKLAEASSPDRADFTLIRKESQAPREISAQWLEALAKSPLLHRLEDTFWDKMARPLEWVALFNGTGKPSSESIARQVWPKIARLHDNGEFEYLAKNLTGATVDLSAVPTNLEIQIALLQGGHRELLIQLGGAARAWMNARKPSQLAYARGEYLRLYYELARSLGDAPLIVPAQAIP